jgi:hypothetical protein
MLLRVSHCRLIGVINGCKLRVCKREEWYDIHTKFHQNVLIELIRMKGIRHAHGCNAATLKVTILAQTRYSVEYGKVNSSSTVVTLLHIGTK